MFLFKLSILNDRVVVNDILGLKAAMVKYIKSQRAFFIVYSKMVGCAVNVDTSFAQCLNREYRTVNKARC